MRKPTGSLARLLVVVLSERVELGDHDAYSQVRKQ
jgi:hypothetical protein